ncbi:hypothetical protein R3X25_15145 [Lutibacter sp. TH_r2]|uniref:hypothetical protein n=1 Tax=Lutibacter sp. TH_r2 TaxID=3082083 RepID=UPI00295446CF|nr:hypothetical protein [Lutibacter sp. TH_r2]MDV7188617.1 hypothetical protein [Lutibacter sp. TH_r2]
MKKATLLLTLLLISNIGISQNKQGGSDPISGIDIIIKKDPASKPIINTDNNPWIDKVNKLELEYLNLKAREIQQNFSKQDLSSLKTKDDVLKVYANFLQRAIKHKSHNLNKKEDPAVIIFNDCPACFPFEIILNGGKGRPIINNENNNPNIKVEKNKAVKKTEIIKKKKQ